MDKCKWVYDDHHNFWETECDGAFAITNGTPEENEMKYCPYCGKLIEQIIEKG